MTDCPVRLSIVIPVYNVEALLDRCVMSVLSQPERDFEIILVDDGSPDNSPAMCDDFARRDRRVKVIHKVNGGLSSARNAGIAASEGEYLMFLDGDDAVVPGTVAKVYEILQTEAADVHRINYVRCTDADRRVHRLGVPAGVYAGDDALYNLAVSFLMGTEPTYSCMLIVRRSVLEYLHFDESVLWMEDMVFLGALFSRVRAVNVTDEVLYEYWFNGESLTRNPANLERNILQSAIVARRVMEELDGYPARLRSTNVKVVRRRIDLLGRKIVSGFAADSSADRALLERAIQALSDDGSLAWCTAQVGPAIWLNPTAVLTEAIRRENALLAWSLLRVLSSVIRLRDRTRRLA
jgi:glycosyltransferase involved in cell wall biosynthesis